MEKGNRRTGAQWLELLSENRAQIMGFAILWIMYFHFGSSAAEGSPVWFIRRIGFYGVDMFLLVSGMGLACSLQRDPRALPFYGRRARRLLPSYLIAVCVWYWFHRVSPGDFVLSVSTAAYWLHRVEYFEWFLPTLVLFYLVSPLILKILKRIRCKASLITGGLLLSLILILITNAAGRTDLNGSFVRIPVFLLGFWTGWMLFHREEAPDFSLPMILEIFLVGMIAAYYIHLFYPHKALNCYPALLVAPSLSLLIAAGCSWVKARTGRAARWILLPLTIAGRYSLEIYLIQERLNHLAGEIVGRKMVLVLTLIGAVVLREAAEGILRVLERITGRKKEGPHARIGF